MKTNIKMGSLKARVAALERRTNNVTQKSSWNTAYTGTTGQQSQQQSKKLALKYSIIFGS